MKDYYIKRIELVESKAYGKVIEVVASQRDKECPPTQKLNCERTGIMLCPTFVIKYTRHLYIMAQSKRDHHEPVTLNHNDYYIKREVVKEGQPSRIYYIQKNLM